MHRDELPTRNVRLPLYATALLALLAAMLSPTAARAQWTTTGNDISNTNTGNVGVGTASPTSKLDVTGTAAVSGDLKVAGSRLKFTFSGPEGYIQGATERLSFWTTDGSGGQAARMRFGGNAATSTAEFLNVSSVMLGTGVRFALGTSTPEGILDVRGGVASSGNGLPIILSAQQGAGSGLGGNVIINSGPNGPTGGTGHIIFGIGGGITSGALTTGEKMRITDAGFVGLGTTAPLQKFQLGGNTPTGTTTPDTISLGATYSSAAGANPKLRLYDDNATNVYGLGVSASQFDFMTPAATRYVWNINGAEKMRLDSAGSLGIGKTPGAGFKLDVNGSVNASGLCLSDGCKSTWSQVGGGSQWSTSGTTVYYGGGNVGVGTSTPLAGLTGNAGMEVYAASAVATFRVGTGLPGKNNAQVRFAGASGDNWAIGSDVATHSGSRDFHFYDFAGAPGARVTIQSSTGNVGLGTSTPNTAKLVIAGTAGAPGIDLASSDVYAEMRVVRNSVGASDKDLYLQYAAGANSKTRIYSNNVETVTVSGGKVGVGKTNPTEALDVVGNITATGNIGAKYQDVAEWVPSTQELAAGTVVVLDTGRTNHVTASTELYDTKVAGVVSAEPGVILGVGGEGKLKVATTGRVKVKADATRSPIKVGDLLVTSDAEGVAMKSVEVDLGGVKIHRPGTIIGKALEPLASGTGEILILLSLQ